MEGQALHPGLNSLPDLNSNSHRFLRKDDLSPSQASSCTESLLQEGDDLQWCGDYGYNKEFRNSLKMPQSILAIAGIQKDLTYEDLSKNIDANLAEIDMETFRSEDINAILTLPAMYGGDFQSASHGEQCASVSGSLLEELPLEASAASPKGTSEDESGEVSICRDEPLFSPVKEPAVPIGNLSMDSLDCSSLEDHDLVLTCQANKDNYTIAFEGSSTHFSDDSDYQEIGGSSEGEGVHWLSNGNNYHGSSMVQSDLSFTTWNRLRQTSRPPCIKENPPTGTSKSQSLPNLLRQSVMMTSGIRTPQGGGGPRVPLYSIHNNQDIQNNPCSMSLLRLFMQNKAASGSLSLSSSHSETSDSSSQQPSNRAMYAFQSSSSSSMESKGSSISKPNSLEFHKEDIVQRQKNLDCENEKGTNITMPCSPIRLNIVAEGLVTNNTHTIEANNNLITQEVANNNNANITTDELSPSESEEDNSQYFEDSLVEATQLRSKAPQTSPIKEEEEPLESDMSSGDETMKESKDFVSSESQSSEEVALTRNNAVNSPIRHIKQDHLPVGVERINNVFPTGKCNMFLVNTDPALDTKNPVKNLEFRPVNQSQGTQTKRFNSKDCSPAEMFQVSTQRSGDSLPDGSEDSNFNTRNVMKDSSSMSSGYISRQNSVDRLHRQSQTFLHNSVSSVTRRKPNASILSVRNTSTQVPVHIRNKSVQTSVNAVSSDNSIWVFTVDDSCINKPSHHDIVEEDTSTLDDDEPKSESATGAEKKKSIYVCYPNYSLPDLSFLKEMSESPEVILKPTQHKLPKDGVVRRRTQSGEPRCRPKSCTDFENMSRRNFSHIKDWESLSVLLPDDIKALVSQFRQANKTDTGQPRDLSAPSVVMRPKKAAVKPMKMEPNIFSESGNGNIPAFKQSPLASDFGRSYLAQKGILRKSCSDEMRRCPWKLSKCPTAPVSYDCDVPNRRHSLQDYKKLFSGLPDLEGIITPCFDLTRSMEGCHHDPVPLLRAVSEGSCRQPCSGVHPCNSRLSACGVHPNQGQAQDVCSCSRSKKAVSFNEDINTSRNLQPVCSCTCKEAMSKDDPKVSPRCLPRDLSLFSDSADQKPPQEFSVSPRGLSPVISPVAGFQSPLTRSQQELVEQKKGLLESMFRAANQVVVSYSKEKEMQPTLEALSEESVSGCLAREYLCPAVDDLVSDGLQPHVRGLFGPLPNSPWHLAESSVQNKEGRKEIQELVGYIQQAEALNDDTEKFKAFIIGVLNLGCLDSWLSSLLTSPQVLQKHYSSSAFLNLISHPSFFFMHDEIAFNLRSLSELPFSLNLSFCKEGAKLCSNGSSDNSQKEQSEADQSSDLPSCAPTTREEKQDAHSPNAQTYQIDMTPEIIENSSRILELQQKLRHLSPSSAKDKEISNSGSEDDILRFKELRNHWEQISNLPTSGKPPKPASPRQAKRTSRNSSNYSRMPRPSSRIRSPARGPSASPEGGAGSRPHTPETSSRTSSPNLVSCVAGNKQRRSLIPVHRGGKRPVGRQGQT